MFVLDEEKRSLKSNFEKKWKAKKREGMTVQSKTGFTYSIRRLPKEERVSVKSAGTLILGQTLSIKDKKVVAQTVLKELVKEWKGETEIH